MRYFFHRKRFLLIFFRWAISLVSNSSILKNNLPREGNLFDLFFFFIIFIKCFIKYISFYDTEDTKADQAGLSKGRVFQQRVLTRSRRRRYSLRGTCFTRICVGRFHGILEFNITRWIMTSLLHLSVIRLVCN